MKAMLDLVRRHKAGEAVGIYSVCSAHTLVLEAALRHAKNTGGMALIEATSNQVNQDGGYTGMRPAAFRDLVYGLADSVGLPRARVLLGGDHLGPNCWQGLDAATAMAKAGVMVSEYVTAGFRKIHLDCSMSCADDPRSLGDALIAQRTATLCALTEAAWHIAGGEPPVYIIGSEVPVPGGAHETLQELAVTTPSAAQATIEAHRTAFARSGLTDAWQRIVGLVVQPGVEFDHHNVIDYQPAKAAALSQSIASQPGMVFEAHSTDYQTPEALKALVRDHFAILKVGPGLTFALREVLWALERIEREWLGEASASNLKTCVLKVMREQPKYWQQHYASSGHELNLDLEYSLSDRIRYYWPQPAVMQALNSLLKNLEGRPPPLALISQYLPREYAAVRAGRLRLHPQDIIVHAVEFVLEQYAAACGLNSRT